MSVIASSCGGKTDDDLTSLNPLSDRGRAERSAIAIVSIKSYGADGMSVRQVSVDKLEFTEPSPGSSGARHEVGMPKCSDEIGA
jgi:hypothetical protein